jgi:hypothetical protein
MEDTSSDTSPGKLEGKKRSATTTVYQKKESKRGKNKKSLLDIKREPNEDLNDS